MKRKNSILPLITIFSMLITLFNYQPVKANEMIKVSKEEGIEIGTLLYDVNEYGNIVENVIDLENAISEKQAKQEYYERFMHTMDVETITYDLIHIDENGNETTLSQYENYNDAVNAYNATIELNPLTNYAIKSQDEYYWKIRYGVVIFKKIYATNSSGTQYIKTTSYKNAITNASGYTHVSYGIDAAYLDETNDGNIKFKLSSVIGIVDPTLVDIIPYAKNTTYVNKYVVSNGNIYHKIKEKSITSTSYDSTTNIGKAPNYLVEGNTYYSYDGHYFYDDYFKMIDDYQNGNYENAVNKDDPYYNYFQYLPLHSQTNYTAEEIDYFISSRYSSKPSSSVYSELKSTESLLYGEGSSYMRGIEFGVNPILTLGVSINESGWGRSRIAITKNNLFGLNAVDSSAQESADTYDSVAQCIEVFMNQYVTHGYLDTKNDGRYYGGHLGDKESGMNVSYASDPYWGEKAASHCYTIDTELGSKDVNTYTLGIKEGIDQVNIYKETSLTSDVIYQMTNKYSSINIQSMPVIILEEITNTDGDWFKIYTDHLLDEDQNRIYRSSGQTLSWLYSQYYNFDNSFGYVEANNIVKVNNYLENSQEFKVDVSNNANGKIKLTWNSVENADQYEVYRSDTEEGTYTKMFTTSKLSYTNTSVKLGEQYYYKVRAINTNNEEINFEYSNIVMGTCVLPTTTVALTNIASGKIKLIWESVEGANQYEVYRSDTEEGTYTKMFTTSKLSYTNTSANVAETYYYKIKAINSDNEAISSIYSDIVIGTCMIPALTVTSTNATSGKIKLVWDSVEGANQYEVYRSDTKEGTYTKMFTTSKLSYTNTSVKLGEEYYYKVRAINTDNEAISSAFSNIVIGKCSLSAPKVIASNVAKTGKIKLVWESVEGADKYEIYRSTSKDGTYKKIYTSSNTYFINSSVQVGKAYYYKVKALNSKDETICSIFSNVASRTCDLACPKVTLTIANNKIKLTWNDIEGADKYEIYRSTSKDGTYKKIYTSTNTYFINSSVNKGVTYYYKVRAIDTENSKANSAYSTIKSGTVK